jgi:hypothetical protein
MIERVHPRLVRLVMCVAISVKRPSRLYVLQPVPIIPGGTIPYGMKSAMEFAVPRKIMHDRDSQRPT